MSKAKAKSTSRHKDVRYFDIHEEDGFDERQMAQWIKQATALPGWSGTAS